MQRDPVEESRPPRTVETILVCLDGSPYGESGLSYALAVASATGARLVLLEVVDVSEYTPSGHPRPVDALGLEIARGEASHYLQTITRKLSDRDVEVETHTALGRSADRILHVAERERADLIVLSSHGTAEATRYCLGSTAQKVVQNARQSILLVRPDAEAGLELDRCIRRVLVGLDGSLAGESVLPYALELSHNARAEIVLAHAVLRMRLATSEPLARRDVELLRQLDDRNQELIRSYLANVQHQLERSGARCRYVVAPCESVHEGLLSLTRDEQPDLLLLASHGHTASDAVVHGGVTQQVLLYAPIPVWVVQNMPLEARHPEPVLRPDEQRLNVSGHQHA